MDIHTSIYTLLVTYFGSMVGLLTQTTLLRLRTVMKHVLIRV